MKLNLSDKEIKDLYRQNKNALKEWKEEIVKQNRIKYKTKEGEDYKVMCLNFINNFALIDGTLLKLFDEKELES